MKQIRRLHTYTDQSAMIAALRTGIAKLAAECLREHGIFRCVLAGGETPRKLYEQLRSLQTDWHRWHIYFGDERCVPADDAARNDVMAMQTWLAHVAIPSAQIHRLHAELDPVAAVADCEKQLAGLGNFDLVLLGLGEDGHTASLFPGMPSLADEAVAIAVDNAPKLPSQRLSLSAKRLSAADQVWFIVSGESKRAALTHWLSGAALPAALIMPAAGIDIHTDLGGIFPL